MIVVGRGWIGQKIGALLGVEPISHSAALESLPKADWVINCAGVTGVPNVDACENHKAEVIEANSAYPLKLFEKAKKQGARFAHFSSGCIYHGGPFHEDEPPNFWHSTYSLSKFVSDQALQRNAAIFRIRMPFSADNHPKNLLTKLAQYAAWGKLWDGLNSITEIDEACSSIAELIRSDCPNGNYNAVNNGAIKTSEIADLMGFNAEWWGYEEFMRLHTPRSVCTLYNSRVSMSPVRDALARCVGQRKAA